MTLEGANNFSENSNSTIYTMNSPQTGQYSIVMPKNIGGKLSMLIDLNMKSVFDSVINNSMTKDTLVKQINEEYETINSTYPNGVLVFPMLDINLLTSSINSGDKQKMFDETKKIGSITSEIYNKLSNSGVEKSKINQKIIIVEKTETDNKFVSWLKEQMPNFVDGISFEELKNKTANSIFSNNPFENINPFTGETNQSQPIQPTNDIFGPSSQSNVEPISESQPTNDIFSQQQNNQPTEKNDTINNEKNELFEPKPIQNQTLESTQVLSPINEQQVPKQTTQNPENIVNNVQEENETNDLDKKSGGFANLLILLVILIGVTVASIELGKFLYNTFGA